MNCRRFTSLGIAAVLATASIPSAQAWDSVARPAARDLPGEKAHFYPYTAPGEPRRWVLEVIKDRIGGTLGDPNNPFVTKVQVCPPDFDDNPVFAGCSVADTSALQGAGFGWQNLRKSWDANDEDSSEHYLIAREAAAHAGLLANSRIFQTFFVRYQTYNERLASPAYLEPHGGDTRPPDAPMLVGQSWRETNLGTAESHAVRGVSLLELAQIPDFSSSVADWAAGNELCPFSDLDGAFTDAFDSIEACHRFELLLGAINVTHFAPLNHQMWSYYHSMAMTRMTQCSTLTGLSHTFYGDLYDLDAQSLTRSESRISANDTEAHECEREAMVYEMFAQHFMQDAWATGHMWKRWGETELSRFPSDFTLPTLPGPLGLGGEFGPTYEADEERPRQTAIAMLVAALAGAVHGAKSVIVSQLRNKVGLSPQILAPWLTDDPLNGPTYASPYDFLSITGLASPITPVPNWLRRPIHWMDDKGNPQEGAGDLFWTPKYAYQGSVSASAKWQTQRDGLIRCTAASMYEAYTAGETNEIPRVHGQVPKPDELTNIDPSGASCWNHWASNEAMRAALGFDLSFTAGTGTGIDPHDLIGPSITTIANEVIFDDRKTYIGFPKEVNHPGGDAERDQFLKRMRVRMMLDMNRIRESYTTNQEHNPRGTDSARGLDPDSKPISLINTLPVADPDATTKLPDLVPYVDTLAPQPDDPNGGVQPEPTADLDLAMSRLFWRGNLPRTCRESGANDGSALYQLRTRCINGAVSGGDADACTACVNLAEIHIPYCVAKGQGHGQSKCSLAGGEPSNAPGLPSWWFDNDARSDGQMGDMGTSDEDACAPPYTVAFDWCTGGKTPFFNSSRDGVSETNRLYTNPIVQVCKDPSSPGDPGSSALYGEYRQTVGRVLTEPGYLTDTWVPPMVTARLVTTVETPDTNPCVIVPVSTTHSYDGYLHSVAAGLALTERRLGYQSFPEYPRCGTIQRVVGMNRSCAQLNDLFPYNFKDFNKTYTKEFAEVSPGNDHGADDCVVALPREFKGTCPQGSQCNAGGECVPSELPAPGLVKVLAKKTETKTP